MSDNEKKYSGYGYHGGGRSRKSESGRVSFCVSCTEDERKAIRDKAELLGIPVSELVVSAIKNYAGGV